MTLVLDGMQNLRDVGGLPLADGGRTRSGVLYRSDALANMSPIGREAFAISPIGVVVDFRTDLERQAAPDEVPDPVRLVELPIRAGSLLDSLVGLGEIGANPTPEQVREAIDALPGLGELYVMMLQDSAGLFAEAARLTARADDARPATLIHCTAGKDRTGVGTALMLDIAGVVREAIIEDYSQTERNLAGPWAEGILAAIEAHNLPLTDKMRELAAGSPRGAIEHALAWVDATFGGAAGYLTSGGLTDAELAALRARLAA